MVRALMTESRSDETPGGGLAGGVCLPVVAASPGGGGLVGMVSKP